MRRLILLAAAVLLILPRAALAQGPSGIRFESLNAPDLDCSRICTPQASQARMSKGGKAILIGAAIGGGLGLLSGALVYGLCANNDHSAASCAGSALLAFGLYAGLGALIGGFIGAPGHPPATDAP
jgi:hypothetical protein